MNIALFISWLSVPMIAIGIVWFLWWFNEQRKRYLILTTKRLAGNATEDEMTWWLKVNKHRYVSIWEFFKYWYRAYRNKTKRILRASKNVLIAAYHVVIPKKREPIRMPTMTISAELPKREDYIAPRHLLVNIGVDLREDAMCAMDGYPADSEREAAGITDECCPFENRKKTEVEILHDAKQESNESKDL